MEKYYEKAAKFAQEYHLYPSAHIIDVMASVMMTRDGVQQGGSFVQCVVKNDLYGAISRADAECLSNLKIIVLAKEFAHVR
jgi:hypothetical protein